MQITEIKMRIMNTEEANLKAVAVVTFDDCFVVHDIKIVSGDKGLFISMPSRRTNDGAYRDIAHPITQDFRETIQSAVISKYKEMLTKKINEV